MMETDFGRVPTEPGSRASTEPQSSQGLGPPGFDPSRASCSTCRHWKPEGTQDWEAERAGFGECLGIRERWAITDEVGGYRVRHFEDDLTPAERIDCKIEERTAALRAARAYVQDGSEYRAELFTAPDFFCALYAAPAEPRGI